MFGSHSKYLFTFELFDFNCLINCQFGIPVSLTHWLMPLFHSVIRVVLNISEIKMIYVHARAAFLTDVQHIQTYWNWSALQMPA